MASLEKFSNELIDLIEKSVDEFNSAIPELQRRVYDEIATMLKNLDAPDGQLRNSVQNIRAIGQLKARIEQIVLNPEYLDSVTKFARAFDEVGRLQNTYFNSVSEKFSPGELLDAIKQQSVQMTVSSLTEAGITSDITEGIQDILQRNITGGGKYSDLLEQTRNFLTTNNTGPGALERYAKQITTDSLNQFSAQYTQAVTDDLGFEWFMYVGSNIKTTRQFCLLLTKKKFIHKSELPDIVRGIIDGVQVPINPKTKTWAGGIPGTNASNIQVNRGGYGCGHQMMAVPALTVPAEIRARFSA